MAFVEQLIVVDLVKKFPVMDLRGSSMCSQKPVTRSYLEPDHIFVTYFSNANFNIILPSGVTRK
jgi:hypothetical protein